MSEQDALARWRAGIAERAAGRKPAIARGASRQARPKARQSWFCEGRWQHDEQMDLWQCLDEVELDARAERGNELEDDTDDEPEEG